MGTLPFYRSLLERIEEHISALLSSDSLPTLSSLYRVVLSKVCSLNAALAPSLVSDVSEFLSLVTKNLKGQFQDIAHRAQKEAQQEFQRK